MTKKFENTTPEQSPQDLSPMSMLFSEVQHLYGRTEKISDKVNTLAGQLSIVSKIVWLLFALVLTAAATSAINHLLKGLGLL